MTADILRAISNSCLVFAAIFLVLSVILFFRLKIRDTIYDLTGRKRASEMKKMQSTYALTGSLLSSNEISSGCEKEQQQGLFNTDQMLNTADPVVLQASVPASETGVMKQETSRRVRKKSSAGRMKITKQVILIHTDEKIG